MAQTRMAADARATALMVTGRLEGATPARRQDLDDLFIDREDANLRETRVGHLFEGGVESRPPSKVQTP